MENNNLTEPENLWYDRTKIDKHKAIKRIKRWLNFFVSHPGYNVQPDEIPRALFISIEDLQQLYKKYHHCDKGHLAGIRVYFGLSKNKTDESVFDDLRGCIVPVFNVGGKHQDMLTNDNPEDTSIYDFTTPCPRTCDLTSELYVDVDN